MATKTLHEMFYTNISSYKILYGNNFVQHLDLPTNSIIKI